MLLLSSPVKLAGTAHSAVNDQSLAASEIQGCSFLQVTNIDLRRRISKHTDLATDWCGRFTLQQASTTTSIYMQGMSLNLLVRNDLIR